MDFADREVSLDPEDEEAVNEEFGEPGRPALQKSSNGHKRGGDFEDSSEEEDDDDDEEAARIREGFIVDDEDEDDEELADGTMVKVKRRKKRRRSHRVDEEDEVLDEEDLDLMLENTGGSSRDHQQNKFKRLKHGREEAPNRHHSRELDNIFSDEELDAPGDLDEDERGYGADRRADEFGDFIETDESSDEGGRMGSGDERISRRQRSRRPVDTEVLGLRDGAMNDMDEIFGIADYEDALVLETDTADVEERTQDLQLRDVFEPSELQERLLTDEDNVIRWRDQPERFQIARKPFEDLVISSEDLLEEGSWIAQTLLVNKEIDPELEGPFIEAVRSVLKFLVIDNYEVPFVYQQRKDYLIHAIKIPRRNFSDGELPYDLHTEKLLFEKDLWAILDLDLKFRAFLQKRYSFINLWSNLQKKMGVENDPMVEERLKSSSVIEDIQDLHDYVHFQYLPQIRDMSISEGGRTAQRRPGAGKSVYERIRAGKVYRLVRAFGISAEQFALNFQLGKKREFAEDLGRLPLDMADECTEYPDFPTGETAMLAAKKMFAEEMFMNPRMRLAMRSRWFTRALIHVNVTEKGVKLIDEYHQFYEFKYLRNQSLSAIAGNSARYLRMLKAECEGLIEIVYELEGYNHLIRDLYDYVTSDNYSEVAEAWNRDRKDVVDMVMDKFKAMFQIHLRDELRTACENEIAKSVNAIYSKRLDQAPYRSKSLSNGEVPRVFAFSNGKGEWGRDAILGIFMDENGRVLEHLKIDDLKDEGKRQKLFEKLNKRRPDVIGVSGFSVQTSRLFEDIKKLTEERNIFIQDERGEQSVVDVIYVNDEVARLYQNSERAKVEYPDFPPLARYCCALARYIQSPILEYAALGKDVVSIPFHPAQNLLSEERLMKALDMAMVDTVNLIGVEINQAAEIPYIANLLPYVCGLGPRKASSVLKIMASHGGKISSREQLIGDPEKNLPQILGPKVFENAASFLVISHSKDRETEYLDGTRVHPEAYELGRKMAADALDFDEEDVVHIVQNTGRGGVINRLVKGNAHKLNELILEEYAEELERNFNQRKRATLETIRAELQTPYEELRTRFNKMSIEEVFTMLTGETKETLDEHMVVAAKIRRVTDRYVSARLDCGIEGNVIAEEMAPEAIEVRPSQYYHIGQTVQARIESLSRKTFYAELSLLPDKIQKTRRLLIDVPQEEWDDEREENDKARLAIRLTEQVRAVRVIKHPLFKPYNSRQAEDYLAGQSRGDSVIRPSSNGPDHIAVTWKVGENIYQHIDVLELDKPNDFTLGKSLKVAGKYSYSDLDELIVNHVKSMARKVDELCNNPKFQAGSKEEAEKWLEKYCEANPKRSSYAFALDAKRPGYFLLLFKAGLRAVPGCWHVKVIPGAYQLRDTSYPDVVTLCNGFKTMFLHFSQRK